MVARESEAYWPVRVLVDALGFGALAVTVEVVGANAIPSVCAAADATSPSRAQAIRLFPTILRAIAASGISYRRMHVDTCGRERHGDPCWKLHLVLPKINSQKDS